MLQGRANYILVDDFDEETARKFLEKYKTNDAETEYIIAHVGGKPIDFISVLYSKDKKKEIEQMISLRSEQIWRILRSVKELGKEIKIDDKEHTVSYENLLKALNKFKDREEIRPDEIDEISERVFVGTNILFVDSMRKIVKHQSRINLLAIREILKEIRDV